MTIVQKKLQGAKRGEEARGVPKDIIKFPAAAKLGLVKKSRNPRQKLKTRVTAGQKSTRAVEGSSSTDE